MGCPALTAPPSNLLARECPKARAGAHSLCPPCTAPRLPAGTQQPLWDYRLHAAAQQTQKELPPRCSPSPSAQAHSEGMKNNPNWIIHITTGQRGYCPDRTQCQQLPWQDTLKSTGQLDLRRMDNPMVCLKRYRRHRLNINQKEKSTDHHHINGLSLAFRAHYCLV